MSEERNYWQKRLSRRRVLKGAALGGAGLAAAAAIGCGDEEEPKATPARPTPAVSPGATPAAAAKQPKRGGRLVTFDVGDPPGWNLNETFSYRSVEIASFAYSQLTRFKRFPGRGPTDFDWEPHLAKEVNQPDNLTVIFKLQPNAKYGPRPPLNGRKVTSEDIKASWGIFSEKNVNQLLQNRDVDKIETPDQETIVFKLKRPQATFVFYMAHHGGFYPIAKEFVDKVDSKTTTRGGENGPFMLKDYKVGQSELWEKNPNYFDAENVYLDELEMLIIPDPSTITSGFRSKNIHTTFRQLLPEGDVPALQKDLRDATFVRFPNTLLYGLTMDLTLPIFQDVRVRRAISMALDRDAQVSWWQQGAGGPGAWSSALPPLGKWWLDPKERNAEYGENGKWFLRNVAEARKLLEAAGWDFNKSFPLKTNAGFGPVYTGAAEIIKRNLADAGIKTDLVLMDFASFYAEVLIGKHRASFGHNSPLVAIEPDEALFLVYTNTGRSPIPGKESVLANDTTLNDLIDKQLRELNREARLKKVVDVQKYLASQMYMSPLQAEPVTLAHQGFVKNVSPLLTFNASHLYNAWLDL